MIARPTLLLRQRLSHPRIAVRGATIAAILFLCALPVGAVLGLLGGLYGTALLFALLACVAVMQSLDVCLLMVIAVICLLPFAALPIDVGFSPTLLNFAVGALFFVWIARIASHKEPRLVGDPPTAGVLTFAALAVVSFIAGLSHAQLTSNVIRHFAQIILSILTFFLVINMLRTLEALKLVVRAIIICGFVAAAVGIVLYVLPTSISADLLSLLRVVRYPTGDGVLRYIEENPDLALRATSTSVDPNVLGGMLVIVTALALPHLFARRPLLPRWLSVIMVSTMTVCLLLTYSRSSLVGLGVAVAVLGFLRWRRLLWLGLVFVLGLAILPPAREYATHFVEGVFVQDLATQMRIGEYRDALTLIGRYPWFGVGFAGTPDIDTYLGVSSVYLLIAEEMGLVGLAVFLATLGVHLARVFSVPVNRVADSELGPLVYGSGVSLAGAMVAGALDHYLFNLDFPHAATLLWLLVAVGTVSVRLARQSTGVTRRA